MTQLFGEMYFGQQNKNWPWPNNFLVWKVSKNELIPILFTYLWVAQFNADGNKKTKHSSMQKRIENPFEHMRCRFFAKMFLQKDCIADVWQGSKYAADTQVHKMQRDYPSKDKT